MSIPANNTHETITKSSVSKSEVAEPSPIKTSRRISNFPNIENWEQYLDESKILFDEKYKRKFENSPDNLSLEEFKAYNELGKGTYGNVLAVHNKRAGRSFAMKILRKQKIVERKQVQHTLSEKHVLQSISFRFVVNLSYFFMDRKRLFFIVPLGTRGDLFRILRINKNFSEKLSRFYGGQVVLALEYLHYMNLIYRDLKPENIVVCDNGYIKLTDFGFTKILKGRAYSFCGTPEYMAPEIILSKGYNKSVDWWACGVLLYEMMAGYSPFHGKTTRKTYQKVIMGNIKFPKTMTRDAMHLIRNLIQVDLSKRFGNLRNGVKDVKNHPWFSEVDWLSLVNALTKPPFLPEYRPAKKMVLQVSNEGSKSIYSNIFKDF